MLLEKHASMVSARDELAAAHALSLGSAARRSTKVVPFKFRLPGWRPCPSLS